MYIFSRNMPNLIQQLYTVRPVHFRHLLEKWASLNHWIFLKTCSLVDSSKVNKSHIPWVFKPLPQYTHRVNAATKQHETFIICLSRRILDYAALHGLEAEKLYWKLYGHPFFSKTRKKKKNLEMYGAKALCRAVLFMWCPAYHWALYFFFTNTVLNYPEIAHTRANFTLEFFSNHETKHFEKALILLDSICLMLKSFHLHTQVM